MPASDIPTPTPAVNIRLDIDCLDRDLEGGVQRGLLVYKLVVPTAVDPADLQPDC